jgi:hypothetical protein
MSDNLLPSQDKTYAQEQLLCCSTCGSTEFCITQEHKYSFSWIRCRQCDKVFGLAEKLKGE